MMIHSSSTNLFSGVETVRLNALDFFPHPPDEMGLWPKGVVGPCWWLGDLVGAGVC